MRGGEESEPVREERIASVYQAQGAAGLGPLLAQMHPADLADVVERVEPELKQAMLRALAPATGAEVLAETNTDTTRQLLGLLGPSEVSSLLHHMSPEDAAQLLDEDVPERQQELLGLLAEEKAAAVRLRLAYPPRTAGRLMTRRFVRLEPHLSAEQALFQVRQQARETENVHVLYVVDEEDRLVGVVPLRVLLTAPDGQRVADFMEPEPESVRPEVDQEEVAQRVMQYDLLSVPVTEEAGRLLGIVTVDDVMDVLVQEATEDVLAFGSVPSGAKDEGYFSTPILRTVRRRVGWLLVLFVTGTLTVNVLERFASELDSVVALSFFIPLLIGTGGNTGAQTVSTMVRGIATGEVQLRDAGRVLLREVGGGLLLGGLLALAALAFALMLGNPMPLALVVALSVVAVCTWSNSIGALIPLLAQRLRLDPALVSAPLITTLVDATGLTIYLLIARAILHL
jgi:magnesium transporter